MSEILYAKIPKSPCRGCVPPDRNADCHAKCEKYLEWESLKNRINEAKWDYKNAVSYTSESMMQMIKRIQLGR